MISNSNACRCRRVGCSPLLGVFVPVVRENMEMLYQFEHDYRFDSGKVERTFGLTATTYREGIAATLRD